MLHFARIDNIIKMDVSLNLSESSRGTAKSTSTLRSKTREGKYSFYYYTNF